MFWSGLTGPTWRDASASKNTDKQTQHNPNLTSVLVQLWPWFIDTLCWIRWNFWDWSTFKKVFRSNKMFQLLSDAHRPALIKVVHELPKSSTWEKSPSSNKIPQNPRKCIRHNLNYHVTMCMKRQYVLCWLSLYFFNRHSYCEVWIQQKSAAEKRLNWHW